MKWQLNPDGSILVQWGTTIISFKDLDEIDSFSDKLNDARNHVADLLDEGEQEGSGEE